MEGLPSLKSGKDLSAVCSGLLVKLAGEEVGLDDENDSFNDG
jgi:hypothetical protein